MSALEHWIRGLPERHGRKTLIAAGGDPRRSASACAPTGWSSRWHPRRRRPRLLRAVQVAVRGRQLRRPELRDASDWSPGAPLLYAAAFYATGGAREGTARIVELLLGLAAIVVVYLLGRADSTAAPAGCSAAFGGRRLPALHPLHRRALQRAAGDLHPAGGGAGLPLGRRTGAPAGLARCPGFLFGLTALIRPEYLLVGVAFAVLAAIRVGRERGWRPRPGRRRPARRSPCCCRSSPGRSATRSSSTARCRSRPAAARRSTSAPSCPPTANTSGSRRCWCERYLHRDLDRRTPKRSNGSTRRRSSTASPPATRTCRATRRWARSASRTSPSSSAKTRSATRR